MTDEKLNHLDDDAAWEGVFDSDPEADTTTTDTDPDDDDDPEGGGAVAIPDPGPGLVATLLTAARDFADFGPGPESGFDRVCFAVVYAKRLRDAAQAVLDEDTRIFKQMLADNALSWEQAQIGSTITDTRPRVGTGDGISGDQAR